MANHHASLMMACWLYATFCQGRDVQLLNSLPIPRTHNNLTQYGYFRQVSGNQENWRLYSAWLQDDLRKLLMVSVGKRGEPTFAADYIFMANQTYEVAPKKGGKVGEYECILFPDFTYDMEVEHYGAPYMGYVGRHTMQEKSGREANVWAGMALDGVGPLNVLMFIQPEDPEAFLGLIIIGSLKSNVSFSEYWYGDNISNVAPPPSTFDLPPACDTPKVEYFYETFTPVGDRIQKPSPFGVLAKLANNFDNNGGRIVEEGDQLLEMGVQFLDSLMQAVDHMDNL